MAWGRRCDLGCETWPDYDLYRSCLECGERTTRFSNLKPMSDAEAISRLRRFEFEKHYARYCAKKGQSVDGPLPEVEPAC